MSAGDGRNSNSNQRGTRMRWALENQNQILGIGDSSIAKCGLAGPERRTLIMSTILDNARPAFCLTLDDPRPGIQIVNARTLECEVEGRQLESRGSRQGSIRRWTHCHWWQILIQKDSDAKLSLSLDSRRCVISIWYPPLRTETRDGHEKGDYSSDERLEMRIHNNLKDGPDPRRKDENARRCERFDLKS
ncbi:hypothetical protein GALMADRAFT_206792 [Galerina marginata CBS 339.88]|uniref:Uncharacterized protein n=1 Tax=Galerina marginata (strain CBS 339.88) TaxID=685588 RepID=A0A067TTA4_GALM3|nr:hypothetical protein GALMADRAFT_206792 [Galerina marginata CBS 339.88]